MIEMYGIRESARMIMILACILVMIIQTMAFMLSVWRYGRTKKDIAGDVLEGLCLVQAVIAVVMIADVQNSLNENAVLGSRFAAARYVLLASIAVCCVLICAFGGKGVCFAAAVPAALILPAVEAAAPGMFVYVFCTSVVLLGVRGTVVLAGRIRAIRTGISALSVPEAVDRLNAGVMFCDEKGVILLVNLKMQEIIAAITGEVFRSGKLFAADLTREKLLPGIAVTSLGADIVYTLRDGSAWMFRKADIKVKNSVYFQFSATDVTEQWNMTMELKYRNDALEKRSEKLKKVLENIESISRNEELVRAKSAVHDLLGRHLTVLLRALREGQPAEYSLVTPFADNFLGLLRSAPKTGDAGKEVEMLNANLAELGITLKLEGSIPEDERTASLVMHAVREAVTNAVRHGLATEVDVRCEKTGEAEKIFISNNGSLPEKEITEGGGITQMRREISDYGGTLRVITSPAFCLEITLRGESGKDDQSANS